MEYDTQDNEYVIVPIECMGHPLACSNDGGCASKLRILRGASTHYPQIRTLLHHVYSATLTYHKKIMLSVAVNLIH